MTKVVMFGWDGVPYNLIVDALEKGYLPNLKNLINRGVIGPLNAVLPLYTPPNWYSALTGYLPEKHGITGVSYLDENYNYRYLTLKDLRRPGIWDRLSLYHKKGIYQNIPFSFPAPEIYGIWIGDEDVYKKIDTVHVYPPEILERLRKYSYHTGYYVKKSNVENFFNDIWNIERRKIDVWLELLKEVEWDFTVFISRSPDVVLHYLYGGEDTDRYVYGILSNLDDIMGRVIEICGDDTAYIIMSDHGQIKIHTYLNLLGLLMKHDLIKLKSRGGVRVKRFKQMSIFNRLWRLFPSRFRMYLIRNLLSRVSTLEKFDFSALHKVDWENTKAFLHSGNIGAIKFNLKGVYRSGVIEKNEVEGLLKDVRSILENLKYGDVKAILEIKILDEMDVRIPNIMLEPAPGIWFSSSEDETLFYGNPAIEKGELGEIIPGEILSSHIKEGFYAVAGGPFKELGVSNISIDITDVAPLILYLLNIPIPNDLDGRLPVELIQERHLRDYPPRYHDYRIDRLKRRSLKVRKKITRRKD